MTKSTMFATAAAVFAVSTFATASFAQVPCTGVIACKGQSACKTAKSSCKGMNACKGQGQTTSPIEYAARLTEVMLLGLVALRTGQGVKIQYDGAAGRITNNDNANQYLTREYRTGWSV